MPDDQSVADVMAAYISASGTSMLFAYPGDPTIELLERARVHGIEVQLARREGSAGFMAEAYGMLTGRPGVCVSTLGPGSTALVNPVAAATLDRAPMLAISGQIDTAREPYFTHQVVDHSALFRPVTKWTARVDPASVGTVMRKALRTACAERPGAVHLSCGADTFRATTADGDVQVPPLEPARGGLSVAATNGQDPVRLLRRAKRPVLLAGVGAVRAGAGPELEAMASHVGIPLIVSPMAKGVVDEGHDMYAGVLDMACNEVVWDFLRSADLVLCAGFDAVELIKPWSVSAPVIHLDAVPNLDQIYRSDVEVIGDLTASLAWLTEEWTGQPRWDEAEVRQFRGRLNTALRSGRVAGRLNPTDVVDAANEALPADTVVTTDVGSHKLLVGQAWRARGPRSVLMSNGLSAMGFGVPAAIAAQLVYPNRPVAALVGDGGFSMVATELRLAAALALPLTVVVFVDGSLNRIELKQMQQNYPSVATRIDDIDLVQLASSMDCHGVRASTAEQLADALTEDPARDRPLIVEARIDPSQYVSQF